MSSREIAELTGKNHRDVLRDTRSMLLELHGDGGLRSFAHSYLNSQNKEQPEFLLPKRETYILMAGYSIPLRAKIIDRWQELEATTLHQHQDPIQVLNDPAAMRGLLLTYSYATTTIPTKNDPTATLGDAVPTSGLGRKRSVCFWIKKAES